MVESIKHPKVVLDRQIKYLTVRFTPSPEVDLSDDLYAERTDGKDQWNQLRWLAAGSVGGGTMGPSNPFICIQGIFMSMFSFSNSLGLFSTFLDGFRYGASSEQLKDDLRGHLRNEGFTLMFSALLEAGMKSKMRLSSHFMNDLVSLPFVKRPFLGLVTLKYHALVWTPLGMTKIPEVWEVCGRPGGGLGKKLMEKGKRLLAKPPRPVLVPVPANASMPSPITFTAIDPKAATEALTATALLGIVGATILYVLTFPESVAASLALSVVQLGKEDHGA